MPDSENEAWSKRLLALGLAVQTKVTALVQKAFRDGTNTLADAVSEEGGDRIYRIDREVEATIGNVISEWPEGCLPLLLIAEGMGRDGRHQFGTKGEQPGWRLIIDPIDGTRMLMYDKRSAVTSAGGATRGLRFCVNASQPPDVDKAVEFPIRPSNKLDLQDGFATVLSMFPGTRQLAAELAEQIAERCDVMTSLPTVFDDQYISCGGLMYQLMTGRDLYCLDLRPQFNQILGRTNDDRFIESHPYDLAGLLTAENAGVIMTDGLGQPLNAPLDVHTGVGWCGYANSTIRQLIEPIVQEWLAKHGIAGE